MRIVLLTFLALLLISCGRTSAPSGMPTLPSPPSTATCGTIDLRGATILDQKAAQVDADCFWQAYQQCTASEKVGLAVRTIDVGINTAHYAIESLTLEYAGGQCTICDTHLEGNTAQNAQGTPVSALGAHTEMRMCAIMTARQMVDSL